MSEIDHIKTQLERSIQGQSWHGPALLEILSDVSSEEASSRPIANAHTIWEILRHITANADLVRRRLEGDTNSLKPEEDWPTAPTAGDEKRFKNDIMRMEQAHEQLFSLISALPSSRLHEPVLPGFSTVYVTLHGLVQHNLYHAGQMALLKKGIRGS